MEDPAKNNIPGNDNVIRFERPKQKKPAPQHPPLINLPPATKYLVGFIIAAHFALWGLSELSASFPIDMIYYDLGFVAAKWTGHVPFSIFALLSLITVNFLHAGWFHLAINAVTLVAFGAGIERLMGATRMLSLFFLSSIIALFTHMVVSPDQIEPVIGASGGISGLFGAVLIIMKHDGRMQGTNQRILPMAIIWIAITVLFGVMGGPDGSSIAWVAHIGGFLGGLGLAALMLRKA